MTNHAYQEGPLTESHTAEAEAIHRRLWDGNIDVARAFYEQHWAESGACRNMLAGRFELATYYGWLEVAIERAITRYLHELTEGDR